MTVQPPLFAPNYAEPPDTRTQVNRIPGTPDAACLCDRTDCRYPFCKPPDRIERKDAA